MANVKIFQIGFNKCGTRSMYQFFRNNKLPAMHWSHGTVGRDIRINLTTGRRPLEGHEDYVFYSDLMGPRGTPVFEGHFHYRDFFEAYPGSLFILNTREEDNWIRSRQRHPHFVKRFAMFYGLDGPEEVEDLWRRQWRAHHERVRTFFADKPDVFLEFDIERHGGKELAAFVRRHYRCDPALWGHVGKAGEGNAGEGRAGEGRAGDSADEPDPEPERGTPAQGAGGRGILDALRRTAMLGMPATAPAGGRQAEPARAPAGGRPLQLVRPSHLRRLLRMPVDEAEPSLSDILAHNERAQKVPGLLGARVADLRADCTTLLPSQANPLVGHPLTRHFESTEVNLVAASPLRQSALELHRYEDVFLVGNGSAFTLFRGREVDWQSIALFRDLSGVRRGDAVAMGRGALYDDRYSPANPCHFIVDRMPRVHFYRELAGLDDDLGVTVNAAAPYARFALERLAPRARVLAPETVYHFEELYLLGSCTVPRGHPFWYLRPDVVEAIVPALTRGLPAPRRERRLYLSRFSARRRRLLNEEALAAALARRGFEIVEMSELSPLEQLRAVRTADVVVAPHGAALINVLGASGGNRIIELMNPQMATAAYAALAMSVGAPYAPVFGRPVPTEGLKDAWTVDVDAVEAAIDMPARAETAVGG